MVDTTQQQATAIQAQIDADKAKIAAAGQAGITDPNQQIPASVLSSVPTAPTSTAQPGAGIDDQSYLGVLNNLNTGLQQNNTLVSQKNLIQKQLFDQPLSASELAQLPPDVRAIVQGGNQDQMKLQLQVINDSLQGRNASVAQSIQFLTTGWENAQTQKEKSMSDVMNWSRYLGAKPSDVAKAMGVYNSMSDDQKTAFASLDAQVLGTTVPAADDLKNAIVSQESGGSYTSVGPVTSSGYSALGKYQIMPQDWFSLIGLDPNSQTDQQEFLNNPTQQDQLYSQIMDSLQTKYPGDTDKILAAYYGGDAAAKIVGTSAADAPQPGGMPSINSYVQNVESQMQPSTSGVQSFVDNINNGIMTISQVPTQYRKKVSDALAAQGGKLSSAQQQAVQGMLNVYQTTGVIPPLGMGSPIMRMQFYQSVGAGGQSLVSGAAANKATLAGATSALSTQETQYAANQTSLGTLDDQLKLLQSYSNKVDRSGSPILNKYELYLKGQVQGDADTQALQNIVMTASTEFAKILSGASASISGVTVSTAQDAQNLLNANMTPDQINTIIGVMKTEGQYRLDNQKNSINQIQSDIKGMGTSGSSASSTAGGSNATQGTTPSGISYTITP